jgi:hypothetical protein
MNGTTDTDGAKIEAMLTPLIKEHGYDLVRDHLQRLIGSARWPDYQRVDSIAKNIARRLERGRLD